MGLKQQRAGVGVHRPLPAARRLLHRREAKGAGEVAAARVGQVDDPQGVELGGVLKNIYALGMGIVDAYPRAGRNFNGAFITQSLAEMRRLAVALGGRAETLLQVPGVGDLITTAFSEDSHNRRLGTLLAEGHTVESARGEMGTLPEGYNTLRAALGLAQRHQLDLPLAELLWQLIHRELSAEQFFPRFAGIVTRY